MFRLYLRESDWWGSPPTGPLCTRPPPASQAGRAVSRCTQSGRLVRGCGLGSLRCLVSSWLVSAPLLEPPGVLWRPQSGCQTLCRVGPLSCPGPISSRRDGLRQHPQLAACGDGLWVFKPSFHVASSLPAVLTQDSPWAWLAGFPTTRGAYTDFRGRPGS